MRISVFGLGYVGTVSAGCLAEHGHEVVGVDPARPKTELINVGQSPIVEDGVSEIIAGAARAGRLRATSDPCDAVRDTDLSFICVGTPSQANGSLDLRYVRSVCEEVGQALQSKQAAHTIVFRSTMMPGSVRDVAIPLLEKASGRRAGIGFGVCYNPEFLREGSSVQDFNSPPMTVIGEYDVASGDTLAALVNSIDAPVIRTDLETAEMVKYVCNSWHAVKVGFANEVGSLCKAVGIDAHRLMEIFCTDKKLNISAAYLTPGFAFGGSCLPKDLRALCYHAKTQDVQIPILNAVLPSNQIQVARGLDLISAKGNRRIGVLGFSFKEGTDDLRESPIVELIERLIGKGYDLRLYDENVAMARLIGANREFLLHRIPHISRLMVDDLDAVFAHAQTVVIGNRSTPFQAISERLRPDHVVVDLVRLSRDTRTSESYEGICW